MDETVIVNLGFFLLLSPLALLATLPSAALTIPLPSPALIIPFPPVNKLPNNLAPNQVTYLKIHLFVL